MRRRDLLAMVAAAGSPLAGCARGGTSGGPDAASTPNPVGNEADDGGAGNGGGSGAGNDDGARKDDGGPEGNSGGSEFVEVPPCPDAPANLTEETVSRYVNRFEQAYKARRITDRKAIAGYIQFKNGGAVRSVTAGDGGFRVRLSYDFAYGIDPGDDHPDVDVLHADVPYDVAYFVSNESIYRVELDPSSTPETPPDPREEGSRVEWDCSG